MAEANRHAGERPPFPSRIQRDRHGGSGAEACQEQLVRPKPSIGPPGGHRLVGRQTMAPRRDLLGEAVAPATYNDHALLVRIDHERPPFFGKAVRRAGGEWPGAVSNCRHADFQVPPRAAPSSRARANEHETYLLISVVLAPRGSLAQQVAHSEDQ